MKKRWIALVVIVAMVGGAYAYDPAGFKLLISGYTCVGLEDSILQVSAEKKNANEPGMIAIVEIEQLQHDHPNLECEGLALYDDTSQTRIKFRLEEKYDELFISYEPA